MTRSPLRVLVTGCSRGLGLEMARQLLARGEAVIATCRDPASAPALAELAEGAGDRLSIHALDVTDPASRASIHDVVGARWGALDLVIHNAGILAREERFGALDPVAFRQAYETNALAPLLLTEALLPLLRAGRAPTVAFITSQLGSLARTDSFYTPSYAMSKAALNMAGRLLAEPLQAAGVAGVLLHLGWVRTAMGGTQAPLEPPEAVAGLLRVIEGVPRDGVMRFLDHAGEALPW